jgi:putative SOS response-associated peptidase YedK
MVELSWPEFRDWLSLGAVPDTTIPTRFNVPPTSAVPIVRLVDGALEGAMARWGLIPQWHRGALRDWKANTINARAEDLAQKPAFRDALRRGRCAVLASGYYEWQQREDGKHPHYIHGAQNAPALLMAGLWTEVALADFSGLTCTVLTEAVRCDLAQVHDRMPVLMRPEALPSWLEGADLAKVERLPMTSLAWHEVGPSVGSVRNDRQALILPIEEPPQGRLTL